MDLGLLTISGSLIALIGASATAWILLSVYVLPKARLRVDVARGHAISKASGRLAIWRSLRSLAVGMTLVPLAVAMFYGIAQWRIEGTSNPARLQSVIDTRDLLEHTLEPLTTVSIELWLGALFVLSIVWLAARGSGSRRRWNRALAARRAAHAAALASISTDDLLGLARETDAAAFSKLAAEKEAVEAKNRERIRTLARAKILTMPDNQGQGQAMSIAELHDLAAQAEREADALSRDIAGGGDGFTPGTARQEEAP